MGIREQFSHPRWGNPPYSHYLHTGASGPEVIRNRFCRFLDSTALGGSQKQGDKKSLFADFWIAQPWEVVERLRAYVKDKTLQADHRIFPITYAAARMIVKKAGKIAGIELRPHDLRRHAATYASRSGVPIEIVSKLILRHSNLSTTQRYLGKISDGEATRWIENLYG